MEKYPKKRAYARGKLREFLIEANLYDNFKENCKQQETMYDNEFWVTRGAKKMGEAFSWNRSNEEFSFWLTVDKHFRLYIEYGVIPPRYNND